MVTCSMNLLQTKERENIMKKRIGTLVLVVALALSTLVGCGSSADDNAELQAQLEALQAELDALKEESEEVVVDEVVEESTEEVVEESSEEVVEESTEEVIEESTEEVVEESSEEVVEESTEEVVADNAEVSADWTTYSFSVNGKTLSLPCSYQELADATGFAMKSSDAKSYLEAGYYTNVNLYIGEDQDLALYVDILNDTEGDLCYADCIVVAISQTEYQAVEQGASMITFAGGLQVGQEMTTADVEAVFGEPQDTYEYHGDDPDFPYDSYTWTYAEDPDRTYYNIFEVSIVNGIIDEITIDHLYYE